MLLVAPASADVIALRTAAPIGEKLCIALNANVKATLAWGDGTTEQLVFDGTEVEIAVKHSDLTITTEQAVTRLYCPDCSLTEIELKEVPWLASLICDNNNLSQLALQKVPGLVELSCEGNELKSLSLAECKALTYLNCSGNSLSTLSLTNQKKLRTLLCGDNQLKSLSVSGLDDLQALWCQGNELSSVNVSQSARPVQICAFDNQLTSFGGINMEAIQELWLDNNKFKSLDLSKSPIVELSASNNELKEILLDKKLAAGLNCYYVDHNELLFNSLPNLYGRFQEDSLMNYNISDQRPYVLTDKVNVNEGVKAVDLLRKNAVGYTVRPVVEWFTTEGASLKEGEDYEAKGFVYTFLKPFKAVYAKMTSDIYPNEVFSIAAFQVVDPTGVEGVEAEGKLQVSVRSGQLQVVAPAEERVRVCAVNGMLVVDEVVAPGMHTWNLPAGIYVVNGRKVVVND